MTENKAKPHEDVKPQVGDIVGAMVWPMELFTPEETFAWCY